MIRIFRGAIVFSQGKFLNNYDVVIKDNLIEAIVPKQEHITNDVINVSGFYLLPGFIDLQINGCGGIIFNDDPSVKAITHMQNTCYRFGTTSILPTLVTCENERIKKALNSVKEFHNQNGKETVPGIHLEGPFISTEKSGIHNKKYVRSLDDATLDMLLSYENELALLTASPEMINEDQLSKIAQSKIILSLGHSSCSYDEVNLKIKNYYKTVTHLFNAMTAISSARNPGVMISAQENNLYAGIIADGCHVHPALIKMAYKLFNKKLFLVTDALSSAGAPTNYKEFEFCGKKLFVRDEGYCSDENGTLGGSSLTMNQGVNKLINLCNIPKEQAIEMATLIPASLLGKDKIGDIKVGNYANFTLADDNFNIIMTYANGNKVFSD